MYFYFLHSQSDMSSMFCWKLDVSAPNRFYSVQQNLISSWLCCECWKYKKQTIPEDFSVFLLARMGEDTVLQTGQDCQMSGLCPEYVPHCHVYIPNQFKGRHPDCLYDLEMNKTSAAIFSKNKHIYIISPLIYFRFSTISLF